MSPASAREAALRAFGGVAYTKEECRASLGLRLLDELQQDARHTARALAKAPAFTAIAVLTPALGIGANTTIFTLLDDVRSSGDPARAASAVRDAIRRAEPNLLVGDVAPMSARLARDLARERVVAGLAFGFGALTLLLASLGLYGVLSYGVARRTQELGVRMALGARRIEVMRLVFGQSARMTAWGIALGLAGAAAAARYLSGLLFGVDALDPATFALVSIGFAIVSMAATYLPARRATTVDPIVALRCE